MCALQYGETVLRTSTRHEGVAVCSLFCLVSCVCALQYGETALHTATRHGHAGVTQILISAKCKINAKNKVCLSSITCLAASSQIFYIILFKFVQSAKNLVFHVFFVLFGQIPFKIIFVPYSLKIKAMILNFISLTSC